MLLGAGAQGGFVGLLDVAVGQDSANDGEGGDGVVAIESGEEAADHDCTSWALATAARSSLSIRSVWRSALPEPSQVSNALR